MDDLLADILLRLPPDEPACLFRASVVCKPWRRIISDPAFLRRYRAFHRAPPVLGFLREKGGPSLTRFFPTTAFRPTDLDHRNCRTLDCRHGRALFYDHNSRSRGLLLWDPVTAEKQHLRLPDIPWDSFSATVLCATAGCDHLDCHGGPFLVVFISTDDDDGNAHACLYSSETGAWSAPTSRQLDYYIKMEPPVLVGNALYFMGELGKLILRYELGGDQGLSVISAPNLYSSGIALIQVEYGGLGCATLNMYTLYLWSLETGRPDGVLGWARHRVIELEMLPKTDSPYSITPFLFGFAKGPNSGIIFVRTHIGQFMIELESERATKVFEKDNFYGVFPYMSFCTPGKQVAAAGGG